MTLEEQLQGKHFEQIPLKVTSGILLHIGAGIYNSVAGAIKELVSNSYDADATRVVISMDYPHFNQIRVVDNGTGMTPAHFAKAMQSIGSSLKGALEPSRLTPIHRRPIIGHMGIGLMALTQVCDEAIIESTQPGSDTKFVAKLDFSEFRRRKQKQTEAAKIDIFRSRAAAYGGIEGMRKRLSDLDAESDEYLETLALYELASRAEEISKEKGLEDLEGEQLGYCVLFPDLPALPGDQGTIIALYRIDPGVRSSLADQGRPDDAMVKHYVDRGVGWAEYRDEVNAWSWEELCERLRTKTSHLAHQSLPRYHQFLWELSTMIPVQYLKDGPVVLEPSILKEKKAQLERLDFSVLVDKRALLKPVLLPSGSMARGDLEQGFDYYLEAFDQDAMIDEDHLKYEGYVFWQRRQVEPSSARGIQIHIRNVGIGVYDQTLMGFSAVNPTSRAGQISAEVYVEEGLERALSVDRNSFRETDAHYIALQEHLWALLGSAARGDGVMGTSVEAYFRRKERYQEESYAEHLAKLTERVQEASNGRFVLGVSDEGNPEPYRVENDRIVLYEKSPGWPRVRSERLLSQQLLIPLRAAVAAGASGEEILALLEKMLLK